MLSGEDARDGAVGAHSHEGEGGVSHICKESFKEGEGDGIDEGDCGFGDVGP